MTHTQADLAPSNTTCKGSMPAVNPIIARAPASGATISHSLSKRNWAQEEAGVVVVLCIVFVVLVAIITFQINKAVKKRKEKKAAAAAKV